MVHMENCFLYLPSDINARSILPDGTELIPDKAKIVMNPNGSIKRHIHIIANIH